MSLRFNPKLQVFLHFIFLFFLPKFVTLKNSVITSNDYPNLTNESNTFT